MPQALQVQYAERVSLDIPLQFLAILNMLAALQYISHASSTLWGPLEKHTKFFRIMNLFLLKFHVILPS